MSARDLAVKSARDLVDHIRSGPKDKEIVLRLVDVLAALGETEALDEMVPLYQAFTINEYVTAAMQGLEVCPQQLLDDFDAICGAADVLRDHRMHVPSALEHAIENPDEYGPIRDYFRLLPE